MKDEMKNDLQGEPLQVEETKKSKKKKKGKPSESEQILGMLRQIAFSEQTKDSDRIRALDLLSVRYDREQEEDAQAILHRLDDILEMVMTEDDD